MDKMLLQLIIRFHSPTDFDNAPHLCLCFQSDDSIWVQASEDENHPVWIEFKLLSEAISFIRKKITTNKHPVATQDVITG